MKKCKTYTNLWFFKENINYKSTNLHCPLRDRRVSIKSWRKLQYNGKRVYIG